jgi:hypothetical protein
MELSLRARLDGLERKHVAAALAEGRLARTWTLRGTMHLHDPRDLRWLVPLLGPASNASAKRRQRELGLTEEVLSRGAGLIVDALEGSGPLTRWELMDALEAEGLRLDRTSQAPIHLIRFAALEGLLAIGPDRDGEATYDIFERLAGPLRDEPRGDYLEALARRYLEGYGPATAADLAAWSGLSAADAKAGWGLLSDTLRLREVRLGARTLYSIGTPAAGRKGAGPIRARLLPSFDTYLLGYGDRDLVVAPGRSREVYHGGQMAPAVAVDGEVVGTWGFVRKAKRIEVEVRPFEPLDVQARSAVVDEAADVGRFFGSAASLTWK